MLFFASGKGQIVNKYKNVSKKLKKLLKFHKKCATIKQSNVRPAVRGQTGWRYGGNMSVKRKRLALFVGQADESYQSNFIEGFIESAFVNDMDVCVFSMYHKYHNTAEREKGEKNIFRLFEPCRFDAAVDLLMIGALGLNEVVVVLYFLCIDVRIALISRLFAFVVVFHVSHSASRVFLKS